MSRAALFAIKTRIDIDRRKCSYLSSCVLSTQGEQLQNCIIHFVWNSFGANLMWVCHVVLNARSFHKMHVGMFYSDHSSRASPRIALLTIEVQRTIHVFLSVLGILMESTSIYLNFQFLESFEGPRARIRRTHVSRFSRRTMSIILNVYIAPVASYCLWGYFRLGDFIRFVLYPLHS